MDLYVDRCILLERREKGFLHRKDVIMYQFSSRRTQNQEDRLLLQQKGFSESEIDRLCRLRQKYQPTIQDRLVLEPDVAHLRFLRWLIHQGRLMEG